MTDQKLHKLPEAAMKSPEQVFRSFFGERPLLLIDGNSGTRIATLALLGGIFGRDQEILFATSFEDAVQLASKEAPKLIIADAKNKDTYAIDFFLNLEQTLGLDPERACLAISHGPHDLLHFEALQGLIDGVLSRPLSDLEVKSTLLSVILSKISPSILDSCLSQLHLYLHSEDYQSAKRVLDTPALGGQRSALLSYYSGVFYHVQDQDTEAERHLLRALSASPNFYLARQLLTKIYSTHARYEEAHRTYADLYDLLPPQIDRLKKRIHLAVQAKRYEDIECLYEYFKSLDSRPEDLVRAVCSGLIIYAKFLFEKNEQTKAIQVLDQAAITSAGRVTLLRFVAEALIERGLGIEAKKVMSRFPHDSRGGAEYMDLDYQLANLECSPAILVEKGRLLLKLGIETPSVYRILISRSREVNFRDHAENLAHEAAQKWPGQATDFRRLLM